MKSKNDFCQHLAQIKLSETDRAVALLWYSTKSNNGKEKTASELANELHDEGFPKPNVTRLDSGLKASTYTVAARRKSAFKIDARRLAELDKRYSPLLDFKDVEVDDYVLPKEWGKGGQYFENMVKQINGTYYFEYYDACAVMCRRLMESLIIKVYLSKGRENEIKDADGKFRGLEHLIAKIKLDFASAFGRESLNVMSKIKEVGDKAAHHRNYTTVQPDIDDTKSKYRTLIYELLVLSGIVS